MKKFLAPALLALISFASPAFATPATSLTATHTIVTARADDPVEMTYEQAYAALIQAGYSAQQTVYILTHSQTFEELLSTIAAYYDLLPYHPV